MDETVAQQDETNAEATPQSPRSIDVIRHPLKEVSHIGACMHPTSALGL